MKTDYDDYKRANKIKESWPEKTPLALRDKIFIALIALLVVVPVVHVAISYSDLAEEILPLGGGGLRDSDPKWMLLVLALCDVIVAVALIATIVFPRSDFLADELLQRPAEEIIRGMRFFCGAFGVIAAVFFSCIMEMALRGMPLSLAVAVAAIVLLLAVWFLFMCWLRATFNPLG